MVKTYEYYENCIEQNPELSLLEKLKQPLRAYNNARGLFSNKSYSKKEINLILSATSVIQFFSLIDELEQRKPKKQKGDFDKALTVTVLYYCNYLESLNPSQFSEYLNNTLGKLPLAEQEKALSFGSRYQDFLRGHPEVVIFYLIDLANNNSKFPWQIHLDQLIKDCERKKRLHLLQSFNDTWPCKLTALEYAVATNQYEIVKNLINKAKLDILFISSMNISAMAVAFTFSFNNHPLINFILNSLNNYISEHMEFKPNSCYANAEKALSALLELNFHFFKLCNPLQSKIMEICLRFACYFEIAYPELTFSEAKEKIYKERQPPNITLPFLSYSERVNQEDRTVSLSDYRQNTLLKPMFELWFAYSQLGLPQPEALSLFIVTQAEFFHLRPSLHVGGFAMPEKGACVPIQQREDPYLTARLLHEMMHCTMYWIYPRKKNTPVGAPYGESDTEACEAFTTKTSNMLQTTKQQLENSEALAESERFCFSRLLNLYNHYHPNEIHAELIVLIAEFSGLVGCEATKNFFEKFFPDFLSYYSEVVIPTINAKVRAIQLSAEAASRPPLSSSDSAFFSQEICAGSATTATQWPDYKAVATNTQNEPCGAGFGF